MKSTYNESTKIEMSDSMRSALALSKYIIGLCTVEKKPISNLQLQKILYYIQREFLRKGTEAFPEEIQAWQFGPVVPVVYKNYCAFGSRSISMQYTIDVDDYLPGEICLINRIVRVKREKNPWELVRETHQRGRAWSITYSHYGNTNATISKELIKRVG